MTDTSHAAAPPTSAAYDPLIGATLDGRYRIERVLGAGGMGLVYAARHAVLGKLLAIKVLKQEVSRDEQVMARFRREAQSASAIGSPHICDVSDFGTLHDGSTYFVMEYLDGPSLTEVIEQERPMASPRVVRIAQQLCDALGAAHERGIVHRDLKPDNVHLVRHGSRDDFVKVLDFGIAKVAGAADKRLTQAGQVFGTPHYMSPEQCAGREVDHRTDIYALGVMIYEMATGQVPFDADSLLGMLTKHIYERPIPPRELPPPVDVPPALEAVILKCLAKQPDERYQSMAELRADLDRIAEGLAPHALSAPSAPTSAPSLPAPPVAVGVPIEVERPRRTGLVLLALLGVLVLGGGLGAAVLYFVFADGDPVASVAPPPEPAPPPAADPPVAPAPDPAPVEAPPPPSPVEPPPAPAAPATVRLVTDPSGAEVYAADGTLIGNTPLSMPRPPAGESWQVSIRMPGYQERSLTVSALTADEVTIRLERARTTSRTRPTAQPVPVPTPRPLAPPVEAPRTPLRPRPSVNDEIIDPF
ncbi:MAG TPA: serine/threonine-protein kinase [Sandaracinaceae bacterium]